MGNNIPKEFERYEDGLLSGLKDGIKELEGGLGGGFPQKDMMKPETHKERPIVKNDSDGGSSSEGSDNSDERSDKNGQQGGSQGNQGNQREKDISEMDADEAADSAQKSANSAKQSADNAERAADNAQKSAEKAESEAERAKEQFGENSQRHNEAKSLAKEAREAADDAREAADSAKDAAERAQKSADRARSAAEKGDTQSARQESKNAEKFKEEAEDAEADANMNSWFAKDAAKESEDNNSVRNGGKPKDVSDMNAEDAASEAESAADAAQDAANDAQQAANDAQSKADSENENAKSAKRKYGENSKEYENAKKKADEAQRKADEAQKHANDAQDAANEAQDAADRAAEAAQNGDEKSARENAKKAQSENEKAQQSANKAVDTADNAASDNGEDGEDGGSEGGGRDRDKRHGYSEGDYRKERNESRRNIPRIVHSTDASAQRAVGEMIRQSEANSRIGETLRRSGFSEKSISDLMGEMSGRNTMQGDSLNKLRDDIIKNSPKSALGKICTKLKMKDEVVDELWMEVMKKFLEANTLFANRKKKIADRKKIQWGNRRTLAHDIMQPYHPKNDAAPQNINVFVDVSSSVDYGTVELFASTIVSCCDKLEYSGITLIPFGTIIDKSTALYFKADDVKKDKEGTVSKIVNMALKNNAGNRTNIHKCVDFVVKSLDNDRFSVWLFLTDGEFNPKSLKNLIPIKNKVLFIIYNHNIKERFNKHLKWCVDPNYDEISRCYIELDEKKDIQ